MVARTTLISVFAVVIGAAWANSADDLTKFLKENEELIKDCQSQSSSAPECRALKKKQKALEAKAEEARLREPTKPEEKPEEKIAEEKPREVPPEEKRERPQEPRQSQQSIGRPPVIISEQAMQARDRNANLRNQEIMAQQGLGHQWTVGEYSESEVRSLPASENIQVLRNADGKIRIRIWAESYERATQIRDEYMKTPGFKGLKTPALQTGNVDPNGMPVGKNLQATDSSSAQGANITNNVTINNSAPNARSEASRSTEKDTSDTKDDADSLKGMLALSDKRQRPDNSEIENTINNNVSARPTRDGNHGSDMYNVSGEPDAPRRGLASVETSENPAGGARISDRIQMLQERQGLSPNRNWFLPVLFVALGSLLYSTRKGWFPFFAKRKKKEEEKTAVTKVVRRK